MTARKNRLQEDLFEESQIHDLGNRVKELDVLIARALKEHDYAKAREWTQEQEQIIRQLVEMGETDVKE